MKKLLITLMMLFTLLSGVAAMADELKQTQFDPNVYYGFTSMPVMPDPTIEELLIFSFNCQGMESMYQKLAEYLLNNAKEFMCSLPKEQADELLRALINASPQAPAARQDPP